MEEEDQVDAWHPHAFRIEKEASLFLSSYCFWKMTSNYLRGSTMLTYNAHFIIYKLSPMTIQLFHIL